MNQATISLQVEHPVEAAAALAPDNDGHLDVRHEGGQLVLTASSDSIMGLLRTLDDALGCLRATGIE